MRGTVCSPLTLSNMFRQDENHGLYSSRRKTAHYARSSAIENGMQGRAEDSSRYKAWMIVRTHKAMLRHFLHWTWTAEIGQSKLPKASATKQCLHLTTVSHPSNPSFPARKPLQRCFNKRMTSFLRSQVKVLHLFVRTTLSCFQEHRTNILTIFDNFWC